MRRLGDLDSNSWVAARPYCNGRATASDKVLKRSKPIVCGRQEKMTRRAKASVVGFHCPGCGTIFKHQASSSKLQRNIKHQISKAAPRTPDVWLSELLWCLDLGAWCFSRLRRRLLR